MGEERVGQKPSSLPTTQKGNRLEVSAVSRGLIAALVDLGG